MCWMEWNWVLCVLRLRETGSENISLNSLRTCLLHFMVAELWGSPNSWYLRAFLSVHLNKPHYPLVNKYLNAPVGPGSVHSLFALAW